MKLELYEYDRLVDITKTDYKISKLDDNSLLLYDYEEAIVDLIEEYEILLNNIKTNIDKLEDNKFLIDMVDRWTDADRRSWDNLTDKIKLLKGLLENDRE